MFDKSFLVNKVVNSLLRQEFQVFVTQGCFDIAARKKNLMLIKTLINTDALKEEHALSLRAISYFLSAYPFVISLKNNRGILDNKIIYQRFELPVLTPQLFENFITEEEIFVRESAKGRHTFAISTEILQIRRKEMGFTLEELSKLIGISKKSLYEIENKRVNPTEETVKKLESLLSVKLKLPYEMKKSPVTYLKPKNEFQGNVSKEFRRIGIENSSVYSAPFEIIGKEKFSLITGLYKNDTNIKKGATTVKKLSSIFSSKAIFVVKKSHEKIVENIPVILESELSEIENSRELSKIIEENI